MLLAIFLIFFSAIAFRNIRHGAYLIIFSMPLYLWRFSVLGIPTTTLEIMIYILFLVWIINFFKSQSASFFVIPSLKGGISSALSLKFTIFKRFLSSLHSVQNDKKRYFIIQRNLLDSKNSHALGYGTFCLDKIAENVMAGVRKNAMLNFGIALLFLGAIISTSISTDPRTSLGILKGWFFDPFLFFLIFTSIIKTKDQIISSLAVWIFSGAAVSIISIFYLLSGELTFDGRLKSFFLSPNHLAMYLAPAFLIVLGFLTSKANFKTDNIKEKAKVGKLENEETGIKKLKNWGIGEYFKKKLPITDYRLQFTVLIIISISLYLTYSCGAFLGIFAGSLYLMAADKNILKKCNMKICLIGLVLAAGLGFIFLASGKLNGILNSNSRSSFHSRLMIWSAAAKIIKGNPLFGIGPGTFQEKYLLLSGKFGEPYLEWAVPQPHNIFLAFYLQTGLIGFIGFILILAWFFSNNNFKNKSNIQYPISNIIVSLMLYFLLHGLIDTTYWKNDLALMFWLVLGIACSMKLGQRGKA